MSGTRGGGARDPGAAPSPHVAAVDALHVTFRRGGGAIQALRGVSLEIERGEILGVVGESGSGKTVLGLSLLGLLPDDPAPAVEGAVDVLGVDMLHADDVERRRLRREHLGAVFQDPATSLNPTMNIGRQIEEAAGSNERVRDLLTAVGIANPASRLRSYPHELSGGQQQRVMIAMAIANDPALVVADEPTTALDVTVQSEILRLIARLRDDLGSSFVLVTHDLGVAAEIADRIAVLYAGRLMEVGPTDDILRRPAHPYTSGLLASRLTMTSPRDAPVVTLPGEVPDPAEPPAGCPFAPRCPLAIEECAHELVPMIPLDDRQGAAACIRLPEAARLRDELPTTAHEAWTQATVGRSDAVRLRGVRKSFEIRLGSRRRSVLPALRGIDLDLADGEAVALVGESGSGKSTLLRILAGLEKADEGEVVIAATRPQMVFQDALASLTPWVSVRDQVAEPLLHRGVPKDEVGRRVAGALERVGLPAAVARARPRELSGGQAQRVGIARAVVEPPGLLLADEPTSSLDVSLRAVVLNLLNELRRELGLSMVFVTHDLSAARLIADRIAVMYLGRIIEIGPAEEVAAHPAHPYTQDLLASLPGEASASGGALGDPPDPTRIPSGCPYHPRCRRRIDACPTWSPVLLPAGETGAAAACIHLEERDVVAG